MAKPDYIYAVARIRAKELLCFGSPAMEQLMACKTYEECLRMLNEKVGVTAPPAKHRNPFWTASAIRPGSSCGNW